MRLLEHLRPLVAVLAAAITAPAPAAVPAADVTGTVLFNLGGRQDLSSFGSIGLSQPGIGSVGFSAVGDPFPLLQADAEIGPNNLVPSLFDRAAGGMDYTFRIVGPAGTVPVLVDVSGGATALASPGASFVVVSSWALVDSTQTLAGDEVRTDQISGSFGQGYDRTLTLDLQVNHAYVVRMAADVSAAATAAGSKATASAFVDPTFALGAGVDPGLFAFEFSAGVGNTPAVPEAKTAWLFGAGLALLGLRRRRAG